MPAPKPLNVKVNATVEVDCLMFPNDALEFVQNWIIVKQVDETDGVTTGICYYIRKRKEDDPAGAVMIDSI